MTREALLLTRQGMIRLESELQVLRSAKRGEVAEKIQIAVEKGGVTNNAEYEDAKNEQSVVEGRILRLENILRRAVIIDSIANPDKVGFGTKVVLRDQEGVIEEFTIVSSPEANPFEGRISSGSLVGKALVGRSVGEEVAVSPPAGMRKFLILEIR